MRNNKQDIPAMPLRNFEHSGRELFSQVNKIPPEAAKSVAALFELVASELKDVHQVYIRKKAMAAESKKSLFKLHQLPVKVQECLNSGMSFEEAANHLKSTTGAPPLRFGIIRLGKCIKKAFQIVRLPMQ